MVYSDVTYGGVNLNVTSVSPTKSQKTIKQVVGKTLTEVRVLGVGGQQWRLQLSGIVFGTTQANLNTNRSAIEALDDAQPHTYVDGLHDGTYYVETGSMGFEDSGENSFSHYKYTMTLVEA